MKMLAPGGRIVYSTCSLNPVENEAVVAAALRSSNGEYCLVDSSDRLPELSRRPGVNSWKVAVDKQGERLAESYDTYWNGLNEHMKRESKILDTMFPPANVENLHLDRCWRIYPHLQNSGGFFVAVLERSPTFAMPVPRKKPAKRPVAEMSGTPEPDTHKRPRIEKEDPELVMDVDMVDKPESEAVGPTEPSVVVEERKKTGGTYKEEPYTYIEPNVPDVQKCLRYDGSYGYNATSPFPAHNLFVRNADPTVLRSIYLSNDLVKQVLTFNEPSRLRFISAGIKLATRQEGSNRMANKLKRSGGISAEEVGDGGTESKYRVLNDAVTQILPYMVPGDVLNGDMNVLKTFIRKAYPLTREFPEVVRDMFEKCGKHDVVNGKLESHGYSQTLGT
ncbi:14337_t:CDS:2, partial [Acaulospora colombiana]